MRNVSKRWQFNVNFDVALKNCPATPVYPLLPPPAPSEALRVQEHSYYSPGETFIRSNESKSLGVSSGESSWKGGGKKKKIRQLQVAHVSVSGHTMTGAEAPSSDV